MTLKTCPCCKLKVSSKNAVKKGRDDMALYLNCKNCNSTFILRRKDWKKSLATVITLFMVLGSFGCATVPDKQLHANDPLNRSYAKHEVDMDICSRKNSVKFMISCLEDRGYTEVKWE